MIKCKISLTSRELDSILLLYRYPDVSLYIVFDFGLMIWYKYRLFRVLKAALQYSNAIFFT